ncbi:MAG: bifunctional nuclease family protein [Candidatus Limnocylindrales bacterium]
MSGPLVEMVVESVRVHMLSSQHVVILKETERERYLPIWIGPWEANAIAMRLQGISAERPLTHDLFASTLEELGVDVRRVVISDLSDDTFHARLFLASGDRVLEIDSRPSDALALAVRAGARIFAEQDVLDRAAVSPGAGEDEDDDERAGMVGSALEHTPGSLRDRVVDPRLDVFRDFVNSLGSDQEGESREGPSGG